MNIQDAIKTVVAGTSLSIEQSTEVFSEIMSGNTTDAQIAAFIVALRMKGESPEEITGAATVMRRKATCIMPQNSEFLIDTCGTGGDGANTFNISTASALVAAGAGARVAKHGNRSVSSKCGSADVLEALGVNISISVEKMKECLDTIGICFLFAPSLHKAMKHAIGPRKEVGIRTIFNVLGPLTNPSLAPSQLMGVFSPGLTDTMAAVLNNMGSKKAYIVNGMDSLDEISISAETKVTELNNGKIRSYTIKPEDFGIKRAPVEEITGGDPLKNAEIIRSILAGEKGPRKDIVVLNAAFALAASGIAGSPQEGILIAERSIDSGAAGEKLNELVRMTNS
ncbi:MAG: anthranilate phosphoribosyltransferase [Fibrobacter sp.]|nr:anthranilate phosphoribosyltransferase [Fibrobacter sp.]